MATQEYKFLNETVTADPATGKVTNPAPVLATDQTGGIPSVNLPKIETTDTAGPLVAGVQAGQKSLQDYITALTPETTEVDSAQQNVLNRIAELTGQNTGRDQFKIQQENSYGLPEFQRQQADINSQINIGLAELKKMDVDEIDKLAKLEVNPEATTSFVTRQQNETARQFQFRKAAKAAELGMLQARSAGLSGQIQTAIALADRAVEAKYTPIEDEIKVREAQLKAIEPLLNKQEKQQALAQQTMLQDRRDEMEARKEIEKQVNQVMVQAAQYGADPLTLEAISNSSSVGEALKNSGSFLSAEFRKKVEQQEFDNKVKLEQLSMDRAQLAISRGNLAVSQRNASLAERKQAFEEAQTQGLITPEGQVSPELLAYAQQYASTGTAPSGMPKGTFGIVSDIAKSLPKPEGALVDVNTGVKPGGLSAADQTAMVAMYDLTKKIKEAQELFKTFKTGTIAGAWNKVAPSAEQTRYNVLRSEIVDLLSRSRSGAALTETEIKEYEKKIPGRFVNSFFTGPKGTDLLGELNKSIEGKLKTTLTANGSAIYGFSEVKAADGNNYKVGSILDNGENKVRVNPDGSLTPI